MNRFRPNVIVRLPEDKSAAGRKYPKMLYHVINFMITSVTSTNGITVIYMLMYVLQDSWTAFIVGSAKLCVQQPCTR